jgi:uncharacterized membrane protein YgcG
MKSFLPLFSLAVVFASCSSAYQSGQTPDDVYFSPERAKDEYVRVEKNDDRRYRGEDYYSYEDDRYLRMKIRDRARWSYLDDYYRDPYAYNYYRSNWNNYYYNGYWNPRTYWNCYYNPYAPSVLVMNPRTPVYNKPRTYNLHVFDDPRGNANPKVPSTRSRDYYTPGQSNNRNSDVGNSLRNVFGNSSEGRSSNQSSSNSSRNSNSSSSNSSGSNSSSGGSAPVRKF